MLFWNARASFNTYFVDISSIATLYDSNRSVGLSAKKGTCLLPSAHVLRIDECPASTCEELTMHTVAWKNKWLWQTCFLSTFICKLQRAFLTFSKCSGLCVHYRVCKCTFPQLISIWSLFFILDQPHTKADSSAPPDVSAQWPVRYRLVGLIYYSSWSCAR